MPVYEVIKGTTYTFAGQALQPGDRIRLTEGQAAPLVDLVLTLVTTEESDTDPVVQPKQPESEVENVG